MKKKGRRSYFKHHFYPHKGNDYHPHFLRRESVAALALALLLCEGIYVFQTKVLWDNQVFTAAVVPSVIAGLTNGDRAASGIASLETDALLAAAAQKKADDMAAKGYFAHTSPEGKTPWYWLESVGYNYSYAGENLAVDFEDSEDVEKAWMASPMHHANIVKREYTRIGIGVAQGTYQGKATTFVVQFFATPRAEAAVASQPSSTPTPSRQPVATQEPETTVLGAQIADVRDAPEPIGAISSMAASPRHTFQNALWGLIAFVLLMVAISLGVKWNTRKLEVVGGGAVLVGLAAGLIFYNNSMKLPVQLPTDGQAASIILSR